ncbi:hypothetical protein KY284_011261 [Solanum tuberosum]|nr:hypothetical protein KY284_011261 [Solanum tuberosum]
MNYMILGLHFIEVTSDLVCLVHALMKDLPINIGAVRAGVPEESVDYMAPMLTTPIDVTKTKGPENVHDPTLTTTEHNRRDDLITTHLFGLEMLYHINS